MYLDFFKLNEFPFTTGSDGRFFYRSDIHAEALANMQYTIQQRKGMVLITGEVGAGKTFLGSMLAAQVGAPAIVGLIEHPPDSAKQLLRAVGDALGLKVTRESDKLTLVKQLKQRLERVQKRGRLVAVILDEVQSMPDDALEEIRLMWNWEAKGQRLLQMVLIGQPELRDRLERPRWESLRQRVVLSYHLGRLDRRNTIRYILHRRKVAAKPGSPLRFTTRALSYLYEATGGIPRLINTLCDNTLLLAYAGGVTKIDSRIVAKALRDMTAMGLAGQYIPEPLEDPEEPPAPQTPPAAEPPTSAEAEGIYKPLDRPNRPAREKWVQS